jgi:hypothetical protein
MSDFVLLLIRVSFHADDCVAATEGRARGRRVQKTAHILDADSRVHASAGGARTLSFTIATGAMAKRRAAIKQSLSS